MSELEVNGQRASKMNITVPYYGAWVSDVVLAEGGTAISGRVVLRMGKLEANGFVYRSASYAGSQMLRVVGGKNCGWRKVIGARGYSHEAGVKKSSVIKDAASLVGETVSIANDRVIGTNYVRIKGKAERVLKLLTNGVWYIDFNGVTQVRDRVSSPIQSQFNVISRKGTIGKFEIATETVTDWLPGRTFTAPTVPDTQIISLMNLSSENGGATRVFVLTADAERERMMADFRNMVQSELASFNYCALWDYRIVEGTPTSADLESLDPRMPDLSSVPYLPSILGEEVGPKPGTICTVAFKNMDPTRPVIISIEGSSLSAHIQATVIRLNKGVRPLAAAGDFAGPFPIAATVVDVLG